MVRRLTPNGVLELGAGAVQRAFPAGVPLPCRLEIVRWSTAQYHVGEHVADAARRKRLVVHPWA